MKRLVKGLLLSTATAIFFVAQSNAAIIGGAVTGGTAKTAGGTFIELTAPFTESTPDNTVGNNNFQTPHLYAFDEDQNISIVSTVLVNIGTSPVAGQIVASHYVFFDPAGGRTQKGYVDFDADIFGIITSDSLLGASDFLANSGVTYVSPTLRGLESGDVVAIDPGNASRLLVDWFAGTPGDYVRVLTMESPSALEPPAEFDVAEPGVLFLFGFGLAGLRSVRRKRRA